MRYLWLFLFGLFGLAVWGLSALNPFLLTRTEDFVLSELFSTALRVLLLGTQGSILFQVLQKTQFPPNKTGTLLCLLLWLAHPLSGESVAFAFQTREMLGNTFFFLAILFVLQLKPFWIPLLFYTIALMLTPAVWFFPFLLCLLPARPRGWWVSFGTLALWAYSIFSFPPFYSVSWHPLQVQDIFYLLYPRGPSFPVSAFSFSSLFLLCGASLLAFALYCYRQAPHTYFPASLFFLGILFLGTFTRSSPTFQGEAWILGFPSGALFLWGTLWLFGVHASSLKWKWRAVIALIFFWGILHGLLIPSVQRPDIWLKARAKVSNQREDWLRLAHFYSNRAYYQQSLDVLQEALQQGHDVRLEQLQHLAHTQQQEERLILAKSLVQEAITHPYPYQVLGEMALRQEKWEEALHFFEKAETVRSSGSASPDFFLLYGQVLLELGHIAKAKTYLEKAYPLESRTLWLTLARLYLHEENWSDALFFFRKGIFGNARQDHSFFQKELLSGQGKMLLLKYIDLLVHQGHHKTALQVLREAQKKAPEEKMFLFYEALLLQTPPLSALRPAQRLYRRVLELDPTHQESRRRLSEILWREASLYLQDNLLNIASRTLEESLKWDSSNQSSQQLLAKAYGQQYEIAVKQKKPSKMIVFLEKSIQLDPSQINKRLILGEIYRRKQWHDLAIKQYEAVLALEPNHPEAQENLGLILWKKGVDLQESAPEEAQKALKRFLEIPFQNTLEEKKNQVRSFFFELNLRLGDEAFHQGNEALARQFFLETLEIDENNGIALCRLADIYLASGRKAEAISFLEKGIPFLTDPLDRSNYQGTLDSLRARK